MLIKSLILNLPNFKVINVLREKIIKIEVISLKKNHCIHCGSLNLRKKDKYIRKVKHISIGEQLSELWIHGFKFKCKNCLRYFNQRFDGILPYKRASEPFRREVVKLHHDGICAKVLALRKKLSPATIEKWYQNFMTLENKKISMFQCPKIMGIDEHFFSKKKGYATTLADLTKNKVFDVTLGRSEKSLGDYLCRLKGKDKVQFMLMDLSETYRSIVTKYFCNAKIVADRFHVIRLINLQFMRTWNQLDEKMRYNRGLLSLIRRHEDKLKPEQKIKLKSYLNKVPGLKITYEFKQKLNKLMRNKHRTKKQCKQLIPKFLKMIEELKKSHFTYLKKLGKTLEKWKFEIARMWRVTKTNSITEGLHNKMEVLSRRAYGFRNFNNYRLRVRVHCGSGWIVPH